MKVVMNAGCGSGATNTTLQASNLKQTHVSYYVGGSNSHGHSHGQGHHIGQHQNSGLTELNSARLQNPINLQSQSQSQINQGQSQSANGHTRNTPVSCSTVNPVNMSIPVPVTNAINQHHDDQQMAGNANGGMNMHSNSNSFRQQQVSQEMQQQQHGPNGYQVSNHNQSQMSEFSNSNTQLQQQQVQHQHPSNNSANAAMQQQQQHSSIIVNLGNLLDIDIDDRPHVCQVCQATYKTRTHLRRHMFIHLQNRPYPCGECSKGFNRKEHLNKHIEAVHSGTRYKCHLCGKEISRKDHLARHIKNMHNSDLNDPMVQAQMNPIPLSSSSDAQQKQQQAQTQRANRLSQDAMNENDEGVHFMIGELPSICSDTSTSKPTPEKLPKTQGGFLPSTMSIIDHFKFNPSEFFPASPTSSSSGAGANKKMLNQLYTCRECHETFSLEKDLNIHVRVHKPQPYKCNQCPRAYTRREKLTEHIRCFHQGQKFSCEYCDKQLSRKDHVLRHVRSVHPEVLANRFVSIAENGTLDCASNGNNRQNARSSTNNSSQGNSTNIPSMGSMGDMGILLRSVCHVCLKVFGTSYHLQRHCESCHNGDNRPFACSFCKKQFKRKDHLTKHVKSHCPSMKDTTKPSRGSGARKSKSSSKRSLDSELSTIDHETINSLQIEMTTPDEDVEVAIAIVNTSNCETNTVTTTTTKELLSTLAPSSNSIIPPSSSGCGSGMSITATTINPKLPNSSSTYTRNLEEIINNSNSTKYRPSNIIARKSSVGSSLKNEQKLAKTMAMAVRTTADFTCGHCQAKFPTKEKMIQHLQSHPSSSSSSSSQSSASQQQQQQPVPVNLNHNNHNHDEMPTGVTTGASGGGGGSHSHEISSNSLELQLQPGSTEEVLELKSALSNPILWA